MLWCMCCVCPLRRTSPEEVLCGYLPCVCEVEVPQDEESTAFITPFGCFYYVRMPFGLKNAGATYQRCMVKCFHDQIGRNLAVYVDDIVVKTGKLDGLVDDLEETFSN